MKRDQWAIKNKCKFPSQVKIKGKKDIAMKGWSPENVTMSQMPFFFPLKERKGWSNYKVQRCSPVNTQQPARLSAPLLQCSGPDSLKSWPPLPNLEHWLLILQPHQHTHTERQGLSPAKISVMQCPNSLSQPTESNCFLLQNARQRSQKHSCHRTPPKQTNIEYSDLQKEHIRFQLGSFPNDQHTHEKHHDKENPHEKPVHHFCNFFPFNSFGPVCFMVSYTISNILDIFNQRLVTRTAINSLPNIFTMNSIAFIPISIELLLEVAVIIPSGKRTPYLFVPPLTSIIPL